MAKKKLTNILNLEDSFKRVLREERRGKKLLPDTICLADCETMKNDILRAIGDSLDTQRRPYHSLLTMDVPKNNFCIRPAAVPFLEDWIVYDAFANYIGRNADHKLNATVFSCRFNSQGELLPGVKQWKKFENSFWRAFELASPKAFVLTTDITSYFDNIDLRVLKDNLITILDGSSKTRERIINTLVDTLLKPWAQGPTRTGLGIPQGVDASSILGNLLLHHVDAAMSSMLGIKYYRYNDDMRIIASDKTTAKKALMKLIIALREIGLDVNASKTEILDKENAKKLRDPQTEDMDLVEKLIGSKKQAAVSLALPMLMKIFEGSFDKENRFCARHLGFATNRFILLRNQLRKNRSFVKKAWNTLIPYLELLPGYSAIFSRFFSNFPYSYSTFKNHLVAFLKSTDNVYEWQEMWILDSLLRFQRMTLDDLRLFEEFARNKNKHTLCRAKAILLLGKFGDQHKRHELTMMYKDEPDITIKRAIILACQELARAERNTFYEMSKAHEKLKHTVAFVENLKKPSYFEAESWTPIDIPDWGTY